jgi:3-oxoacyl-[acyl-carrier-protein] synthase-3
MDTNDDWIFKRSKNVTTHPGVGGVTLRCTQPSGPSGHLIILTIDYLALATMTPDYTLRARAHSTQPSWPRGVPALDIRQQCAAMLFRCSCQRAVQSRAADHPVVGAEGMRASCPGTTGTR